MKYDYQLNTVYENHLDIDKFSRMFNNKTQSYKFYWFEAILNLINETNRDLTFNEIVEEMICEAWYTVTHYHLKLGPVVNGNAENFLEHAINTLNLYSKELPLNPTKDELKKAINSCEIVLKKDKLRLVDYVPYKLLYPFFDTKELQEGLEYLKKDQHTRLIQYMSKLESKQKLLYTIVPGTGLHKKIHINKYWREFLIQNYLVIKSWIQFLKVQFLQDRNPGVPGIIYKINPENLENRRLNCVRALWKTVVDITGKPIKEIYTGKDITMEEISIDHFIPRSYIANDELWNLIPMRKILNSSKNNKLPEWDRFFGVFAKYQFYLYKLIFPQNQFEQNKEIVQQFEKCRKDNLNAIWAIENLYIPGNTEEQYMNILNRNLRPIYESAQLQGYEVWRI